MSVYQFAAFRAMATALRFAVPTRAARLLVMALTALSLSSCALGYDCGIVRRTTANGTLRDVAGVTLATVQVDLSESVGPSYLRLSAGVMGPAGSAGAPLRAASRAPAS